MQSQRRRVLGPASARWNDYVGTAAADDANPLGRASLYELASIDREQWTILAVDIEVVGGVTRAEVHAFNRLAHGVEHSSEIERLGDAMGPIPVDTFDVPEAECRNFLFEAFAHIAVRLSAHGVRDELLAAEPHRETG
jgi:hypothetical protein